jgi:hypothetical protein
MRGLSIRFRPSTRSSIGILLALGGCSLLACSPETPPATGAAPAAEQQASLPPVPSPPPATRPIEPQRLVGQTQAQVQALLGAPTTVREQPPALVWAYRAGDCGLELFFYLDLTSKTYRALTYDIKPYQPGGAQGGFCVAELRDAAAAKSEIVKPETAKQ